MTTRSPDSDGASTDDDATMIRNRPPVAAAPSPADPAAPTKKRSRKPLVLAVLAAVIIVGLGVAYLVGYATAGDKVPRNATISGVAVGGLDPAAAVDKLQSELGPRASEPIKVVVGGKDYEITPANAGLGIDYTASVTKAGGGKSWDPRQIWAVLTGGTVTAPVVTADDAKLKAAVAALADKTDAAASDAAITVSDSKVSVTPAVTGVTMNQEQGVKIVRAAYLVATQPVTVPAQTAQPGVTTEAAQQVADTTAKAALAAPIKVTAGQAGQFSITPAMIARALSFPNQGGNLVAKLDADKLREAADDAVSQVQLSKPKNATVRIEDGKPKIIPAVNGTTVSADKLTAAVEPALTATGDQRTVSVELTGSNAKFSTADATKLGVSEVIGEFTTYFPYAEYRNVNIGRAGELINNTLLKPDDVFSLNGIVGERTKANGFTEGNIISGGKFRLELGGGVSQSATTTYNAMFFAGLQDIQHQPHTLFIDRYPPGREATVAWPSLDLKFKNNTKYGVLVQATVKKASGNSRGSITVKMWSTKTYDKITSSALNKSNFTTGRDLDDNSPKCQTMAPVQGFDVNYERIFSNNGEVVKREKFFWRYAPTDRVTCT